MRVNGKNGPMVTQAIKKGMNIDLDKIDKTPVSAKDQLSKGENSLDKISVNSLSASKNNQ